MLRRGTGPSSTGRDDEEGTLTRSELQRRRRRRSSPRSRSTRPGKLLIAVFLGLVLVVALLLMLPMAQEPNKDTPFRIALFSAVDALTGGLPVVDTASHWSFFGEVVILIGIQLGGLGFMTSAALLGLLVSRRLGLRTRLVAATETRAVSLGDVRQVARSVALIALVLQVIVALALWPRLMAAYDESPGAAGYHAIFLSISTFNNAGLAPYSDNLGRFVADPLVLVPMGLSAIIGGLGLPVLMELRAGLFKPRLWSVHTKTTLLGFLLVTVGGAAALTAFEWRNPATFGPLSAAGTALNGFFGTVAARTGFNTIDYGAVDSTTLLSTDIMMFIGGGSASTAGGIKVTTFLLLFFAILAEMRGEDRVNAFGKELSPSLLRQALTVALVGVAVVVVSTLCLLASSPVDLEPALFEVISAFGLVGLTTGITPELTAFPQYLLIVLMIVGRLGPITLSSALALRERNRLYRLPEERAIVG